MKTFETEKGNIPEGATHYLNETNTDCFAWYREDTKEVMVSAYATPEWEPAGKDESLDTMVAIPEPEWVNGLPPVGVECEIKHKDATPDWAQPDFHKTKVIAYGNELVIFHNENTCNGKHESVGAISEYLFRKPKTPQQREEREKLEAAYDLYCEVQIATKATACESFESFNINEHTVKFWSTIVDKTNYRMKGDN